MMKVGSAPNICKAMVPAGLVGGGGYPKGTLCFRDLYVALGSGGRFGSMEKDGSLSAWTRRSPENYGASGLCMRCLRKLEQGR